MRITILTIGSRGDVEPYLALGAGLVAAGHHVRLASHSPFAAMTSDAGLEFFEVAGDPRGVLRGESGQRWLESGRNPFAFMKRMSDAAAPVMWQVMNDYWGACQGADLILFPVLAVHPAESIGEKLGIPAVRAYLQHVHATRSYPAPVVPPRPSLGWVYNSVSYWPAGRIFWQLMRPTVNRWRREVLHLPAIPLRGPFREWERRRLTCLYGFSPSVVPKAPEWGDEVHVTGYWAREASPDWRPPASLTEFLEAGPPPVFVGFGSMTGRDPGEVTRLVLRALAQTGQRGLLLTGWGGLGVADLPEYAQAIDSVPFDWLFPRVAAVVHHGGAGTTGAGLRAGAPTVVVPFFGDQFFWGWRVEVLGAGPSPVPFKRLSVEGLAAAVRRCVSDKGMQARAADLGVRIRSEDGVANAVQALDASLSGRGRP